MKKLPNATARMRLRLSPIPTLAATWCDCATAFILTPMRLNSNLYMQARLTSIRAEAQVVVRGAGAEQGLYSAQAGAHAGRLPARRDEVHDDVAQEERSHGVVHRPQTGERIGDSDADDGRCHGPQRNGHPGRPTQPDRRYRRGVGADAHEGALSDVELPRNGYRPEAARNDDVDEGEDQDVHVVRAGDRQREQRQHDDDQAQAAHAGPAPRLRSGSLPLHHRLFDFHRDFLYLTHGRRTPAA